LCRILLRSCRYPRRGGKGAVPKRKKGSAEKEDWARDISRAGQVPGAVFGLAELATGATELRGSCRRRARRALPEK